MQRSIFSQSWFSVADLKPRLIPQARINRHVYRQQVWFVVQDLSGGRFHRLSPGAHALVMKMDGTQTLQTLWEQANQSASADLCTQNEVVELLVQLHAANLLQADSTPDSAALFERFKRQRQQKLKQWLFNPMSLKLPLLDPDGFLNRCMPQLAWCFGWSGLLLWLAVVLPALVCAGQNWGELTLNLSDRVLSSSNLLVIALVYPVVKTLHELGHAFATKHWGGAVHEMGLMFLVFAPVPYVDASSSSSFSSKYQRAVVAAAGMLVELFVAALAMYVWLLTEPGVVRAIAFNVMLIAGVSTLVVNGNPLLRYDAYYILTDLVELPNLAQRGPKYLTYLWDKYLFGVHDSETAPPTESAAERRLLLLYTPLAWCYRTFVTLSITLFIAGEFFIIGIVLALWGVFTLVGVPMWKAYQHVATSPLLQRRRAQAVKVSLLLILALLLFGFTFPMPLHTRAQGVVWLPDESILHAQGSGFFLPWMQTPGGEVDRGTALYLLEDALLASELEVSRAKLAELQAKYRAEQFTNTAKAALSFSQLEQARKVLLRIEDRASKMLGRAQVAGTLVASKAQDMPGQYYKKGDLLGYVLDTKELMVRVVVQQDDIDLVRNHWRSAHLRLARRVEKIHEATLVREVSGSVDELPSPALGLSGGGLIPTSPNDPNGIKTMGRVFLIDLKLPPDTLPPAFGERVHVRFEHGFEPPAIQGLRRLRQLFLSRFGV
jgi:putative peptide zinc metalloprotease protein